MTPVEGKGGEDSRGVNGWLSTYKLPFCRSFEKWKGGGDALDDYAVSKRKSFLRGGRLKTAWRLCAVYYFGGDIDEG